MSDEKEDWESERVFGHAIARPKNERRSQIKARIQIALQRHMDKDKALALSEEVMKEIENE
jgi:hypothetical protein